MTNKIHETEKPGSSGTKLKPLRGCILTVLAIGLALYLIPLASHFFRYPNNGPDVRMLRAGAAGWNTWREDTKNAGFEVEGSDLRGLNLAFANLSKVRLFKCDLTETIFKNANMSGANASQSLLTNADLRGVLLKDAHIALSNLSGADLSDADAQGASFSRSVLTDANLTNCNLSKANFFVADLSGAHLAGVDFTGADLWGADLSDVTGWESVRSIACANIGTVVAPDGFKEWALNNGALEHGTYTESEENWVRYRDECLGDLNQGGDTHVE
jgi:hypothetical protein